MRAAARPPTVPIHGQLRLGFGPGSPSCQAFRLSAHGKVGKRIQGVIIGEVSNSRTSGPRSDSWNLLNLVHQLGRIELDPFLAELQVCLGGSTQQTALERQAQAPELGVR